MGGLSTGNFLAKYHKKVLLLEKHIIPVAENNHINISVNIGKIQSIKVI